MQRKLIRQISVGTAVVAVAAGVATSAFAASSNRHFGPRLTGLKGGFAPFMAGGRLGMRRGGVRLGGARAGRACAVAASVSAGPASGSAVRAADLAVPADRAAAGASSAQTC